MNAISPIATEASATIDLSRAAIVHAAAAGEVSRAAGSQASRAAPAGAAANSGAATTAVTARPPGPVRWRLALLTLAGVYPVITLYLYALLPLTEGWETWQRTLVLAPLMIVSMVYGIAPLLQKYFGWFLRPQPRR
jgi:hypothetical protein